VEHEALRDGHNTILKPTGTYLYHTIGLCSHIKQEGLGSAISASFPPRGACRAPLHGPKTVQIRREGVTVSRAHRVASRVESSRRVVHRLRSWGDVELAAIRAHFAFAP
jgi:hypothetical protein